MDMRTPAAVTEINETVAALEHWARWSRDRSREPHGHCASIEWRYLPERLTTGEEDDRRRDSAEVNVLEALAVHKAITALVLAGDTRNPRRWGVKVHMILAAHYIERLDGWRFRRYMREKGFPGIRDDDIERLVADANHAVRNRLKRG